MGVLDLTIGPLLVASFFSFFALGILLVSAHTYYNAFLGKDRWAIVAVVTFLVAICIADTAIQGHWSYGILVTNFGNAAAQALMPWEFCLETLWIGFVNSTVQSFYAWRLWKISDGRDRYLPPLIVTLALAHFGIILWVVVTIFPAESITAVDGVFPTAWVWLSLTLLADVLVTSGMLYRLIWCTKDLRIQNQTLLNKIVGRTVQSNALSLIDQVIVFVLFAVKSAGLWWALLNACTCKVLTFSLIASLNARMDTDKYFSQNYSGSYNGGPSLDTTLNRIRNAGTVSGVHVTVQDEIRSDTVNDIESFKRPINVQLQTLGGKH